VSHQFNSWFCLFHQAERLAKDPLRYVRDPTQLELDVAAEQHVVEEKEEEAPAKSERRSKTGFNKRLLKTSSGEEQSFEEARAKAKCYTIAPLSVNFNLLQVEKADQSSQMDLDEEASIDVSMAESGQSAQRTTASKQPRKLQRLDSKPEARVLFRTEVSFEASLNQTAISTASSAMNELDAVGVPTKKEEETINTKLAMRELSMMFSSPAFGVDDVARKTERQTVNQSLNEGHQGADVSYANVGDMLGTSMLDNSILNVDDENTGPHNPLSRTTATPGFDNMALRELKGDADTGGSLSCSAQGRQPLQQSPQENPLQASEVELTDDPGFQIFEEENDEDTEAQNYRQAGFSIFEESREDEDRPSVPSGGLGFSIFEDDGGGNEDKEQDRVESAAGIGFPIYQDGADDENKQGAAKTDDESVSDSSNEDGGYENGDTASISLFGDAVALLNDEKRPPARNGNEESSNNEGDTATISLFNEVMQDISHTHDQSIIEPSPPKKSGGFEVFVDDGDEDRQVS
jgi:hypothetical protein